MPTAKNTKQKPPKAERGSVLQVKEFKPTPTLEYTEVEKTYISNLQKRLETAKRNRDQEHKEFDGCSYQSYHEINESVANTYLKPVKNKGERQFQSGTLRTKMMSFLSSFLSLNLKADISAYNEHEVIINALGNAMEDIIDKTEELEGDEENKMLRQYELLKQGSVFLEELWEERWETNKKITAGFFGNKTGVKWNTTKKKKMGRPVRNIISGLSVYLGNMRQYDCRKQPYLFTVEIKDWVEAEQLYGAWEMWKYVSREKKSFQGNASEAMVNNAWRLMGRGKKGQVEIIKFQDQPYNEFQIILNGIPMLPMGYPLTEINADGEYTIIQQNLEPIRANFAYGKSFIFRNKNLVAVLDEMMRLAVRKTQKSFLPPYLNLSERVVSRTVFMPAAVSRGIRAGDLIPISDKETEGVTNSEFNMIQEAKRFLDEVTVSPTFTGQREAGGSVTATQILQLQKQAKIMMGIFVLSAGLLEKKLATKRLMLLLEKWFDPTDQTVDKARGVLKNKYRVVSRQRMIDKEGMGLRMVMPMETTPEPSMIMEAEEQMKSRLGVPVRMIILNPEQIKKAKLTWVITVNPKERRSSETSKLMFGAMIEQAMLLGLPLNPEYVGQRFAQIWEEDPAKMFLPGQPVAPEQEGATPRIAPSVKLPQQTAGARQSAVV